MLHYLMSLTTLACDLACACDGVRGSGVASRPTRVRFHELQNTKLDTEIRLGNKVRSQITDVGLNANGKETFPIFIPESSATQFFIIIFM